MGFKDRLIQSCTEEAKRLGRGLFKVEIIDLADRLHAEALKERKRGAIQPDAEKIYELFPKKVGKEDALRAITSALKKHDLAYLMGKTNQFRLAVESWPVSYRYNQDGRDLCPNPATFFNGGRYEDDPKEWKRFGARHAAPHQTIAEPEPPGWREAFPDFVDRDKKWEGLQPAQRQYIIASLATATIFSESPHADSEATKLRHA